MNSEPTNTYEALALSSIYQQLLNNLEEQRKHPNAWTHQQQLQLVSDAVGQALQLLSARCSRCDGDCIPLCSNCIVAAQRMATKLSVEEEGHQESW